MTAPPAPQHTRLLDLLIGVSLLGVVLTALVISQVDDPTVATRVTVCLTGAVLMGLLWWWRRTGRHGLLPTALFAGVAVVVSFAGDQLLAMFPVLCAVLVLALDVGRRVAAAYGAFMVVLPSLVMVLLTQHDTEYVFLQLVAMTALFAFVLALAFVLHASVRDAAVRATLLLERDAANADLRAANTRLRRSIESEKELVLARERARSARELHDGLGHRLASITMSLDFAERMRDVDAARAWAEVATARDTTREAMAEMRLWVRALNPVSVEGLRGADSLDAVADAFRGTGVDVRLDVTGSEYDLPDDVLLFCHRFVQEGLTNALRHAKARTVRIGLDYAPDLIRLTLVDDGTAGRPDDLSPGFGLRSLAERARDLGGRFEAVPGEAGVVLTAEIPARAAERDGAEMTEVVA